MTIPRSQSEVERTRNQMLRVGRVDAVEAEQARASVVIDDVPTGLLPVLNQRGGGDRVWWLPAVGEQVMLFAPDGEPSNGVILGGVYCNDHPQPRTQREHATVYQDTAVQQYNPETGVYHIELPEEVWDESTAPEEQKDRPMVVITAPRVMFRANSVVIRPYPGDEHRTFSDEPMVTERLGEDYDEPDYWGLEVCRGNCA